MLVVSNMFDILMICRNNQDYFTQIFPTLKSRLDLFKVRWFIYENNSQDQTPHILKMLATNNNNVKVILERNSIFQNKYANICLARDRLTKWYLHNIPLDKQINGIFWLDTNIIFTPDTIQELINAMNKNTEGVMFSTYTNYFLDINNSKNIYGSTNLYNSPYYYDILAYNYGKYFRTTKSPCLTWEDMVIDNHNLNVYSNSDSVINKEINSNSIINKDKDKEKLEIKVLTCFGGLVLLKPEIVRQISWSFTKPIEVRNEYIPAPILCEHWSFCEKVRKVGSIFIIKKARGIWFMDSIFKKLDSNSIIKKFLEN